MGACPQSSEWCPQSIGISVRLQSEQLSAFVGIRTNAEKLANPRAKRMMLGAAASYERLAERIEQRMLKMGKPK
jgi:hypothetical protein